VEPTKAELDLVRLVTELARLEAGASPFWEAVRNYELARARAEELRFEVTAIVDSQGNANERDRLNALLGVRWMETASRAEASDKRPDAGS